MSLWSDVVSWKTKGEKRAMRTYLCNKGFEVFKHCVGVVDGTLMTFKGKPAFEKH